MLNRKLHHATFWKISGIKTLVFFPLKEFGDETTNAGVQMIQAFLYLLTLKDKSDHLLVEDEVRGKVEHLGVGVFVRSPAE